MKMELVSVELRGYGSEVSPSVRIRMRYEMTAGPLVVEIPWTAIDSAKKWSKSLLRAKAVFRKYLGREPPEWFETRLRSDFVTAWEKLNEDAQ